MERQDYLFAGGVITCISILFLAVSTYEIPFYAMEANIQLVSILTTIAGLVVVAYGYMTKSALRH